MVTRLVSDHGVSFDSAKPEMDKRIVGTILEGPDAADCFRVRFSGNAEALDLPRSIIEPSRR